MRFLVNGLFAARRDSNCCYNLENLTNPTYDYSPLKPMFLKNFFVKWLQIDSVIS